MRKPPDSPPEPARVAPLGIRLAFEDGERGALGVGDDGDASDRDLPRGSAVRAASSAPSTVK
jgi:hypothetical protein